MDPVLQPVLSLCNIVFILQFNLHGNECLWCCLCCVRRVQYENTTVESPIEKIDPANIMSCKYNGNHNVGIVQYIHILEEGAFY